MTDAANVCAGCFAMLWIMALYCLTLSIGSIAFENYDSYDAYAATGTSKLTNLYDMGRDWQQETFTDIRVVNDTTCGPGWEVMFSRTFGGAETGCNCLGISNRYIDTDNEFNVGEVCSHNETRAGCDTPSTFPAFRMTQIGGKRICGKLSGENFLTAVLPLSKNSAGGYFCEEGYTECLDPDRLKLFATDNTFCYRTGDEEAKAKCPITDVQFVETVNYKPENFEKHTKIDFDDKYFIVFSKTVDSRPITSFEIGP